MKYKGKQGNSYLFECDGEELELEYDESIMFYYYKWVAITQHFEIATLKQAQSYKDIQTAVSMMQILIEEGEV